MSIVDMNKISIVGFDGDKSDILRLLMDKGVVQIDEGILPDEDELKGFIEKDSDELDCIALERTIYDLNQSMEVIHSFVKLKKPMFSPKRELGAFSEKEALEAYEKAEKVNSINKEISGITVEDNQLRNQKEMLAPWSSLDVPLGLTETKFTKIVMGTLPIGIKVDEIRVEFDEKSLEAIISVVNSDKLCSYVYIISHRENFDDVFNLLRNLGFSQSVFADEEKTPIQAIKSYDCKLKENVSKRAMLINEIKDMSVNLPDIENAYDFYCIERDRKKAVGKLIKTEKTFCLSGWVTQKASQDLDKELTETFACYVETEAGTKEEGFPILLENNALVTPFETVTNMYSVPGVNDVDPNPIMAFFYVLFFGMMLSDAGYGIIITIACGFIVWKSKMKKGEGNLIKLLGLCGISTTIWGIIFGGVFGDLIPIPALINPLDDVMVLMGMSMLFGILHIYVGLGMKAYKLIRDGKVLDAIFDIGFWYLFITGACLLVIPIVAGDIGIFSEIGKYLAIIGAVGLILTQGRSYKGIFMKGFKGVGSLYDITSYFSDILSYSRLMALCLSTGVIGQVINLLGEIAGPVPAVIIGVIGHTANLAINALGAYVHTSRLQYVEFFGKFYEGGGEPFKPFKYKTKYTTVNK